MSDKQHSAPLELTEEQVRAIRQGKSKRVLEQARKKQQEQEKPPEAKQRPRGGGRKAE